MKRYIRLLLFASFLGIILGIFFYNDINNEVRAIANKENILYVFQAGVYKEYDNALNMINCINVGKIYHDKNYYRVIIGITSNSSNKDKLITYFKNNNINYYLKEMHVNKSVINDLDSYELVLSKTDKKDIIDNINERMLDIFISYLN